MNYKPVHFRCWVFLLWSTWRYIFFGSLFSCSCPWYFGYVYIHILNFIFLCISIPLLHKYNSNTVWTQCKVLFLWSAYSSLLHLYIHLLREKIKYNNKFNHESLWCTKSSYLQSCLRKSRFVRTVQLQCRFQLRSRTVKLRSYTLRLRSRTVKLRLMPVQYSYDLYVTIT